MDFLRGLSRLAMPLFVNQYKWFDLINYEGVHMIVDFFPKKNSFRAAFLDFIERI